MPGVMGMLRRALVGRPLATDKMEDEKVGPAGGLALFAADAMSSVAYGPEEVLLVLVVAGTPALGLGVPIGIALALLIIVVATSYRQTVLEYPSGGGAYIVSNDNLGPVPAQIAGAALLTDYVLTVSVSVAAGVAAMTSAVPALHEYRVVLGVAFILLIMVINLRGARETAAVFALPVYGFIAFAAAVLVAGFYRLSTGSLQHLPPAGLPETLQPLTAFLVLRAFSSGCASLTGIEAVANGVQALREPRGPNAAKVMVWIAAVLATTVVGVSVLAHAIGVIPRAEVTVLSQVGEAVFGRGSVYFGLQIATMLILVCAANTSFAGFPRLSALMAADGYMPRQMMNLGDRLVFANGIMVLAGLSAALLVCFGGEVTRLIPLYAVGVFTAFTLSQLGMVIHWLRKGGAGWRLKASVNGLGATVTGIVLLVVAITKFALGAWVVCLLIPGMVAAFQAVSSHYRWVAGRLSLQAADEVRPVRNLNLLLVGGMHRGTLEALRYMKAQSHSARAVHVEIGGDPSPRIAREWRSWEPEVPLVVLESPYRDLTGVLLRYIEQVRAEEGYDYVTVVLPEFAVRHWWESLLHNHTVLWLQIGLRQSPGVATLHMRYRLAAPR